MIGFHSKASVKNGEKGFTVAGISPDELNARLNLLYDVALKANSLSEVSQLVEQILGITQRIVKGSASSLLLVDEAKAEMYFQAAGGAVGVKLSQARLDLKSGIAGWVAHNQKPLLLNDVYGDKRFNREIDKITGFVTKSVIAVPVVRVRKTIGVVEVLNRADGDKFNGRDLAVLTGFAATEAIILLVSMAHTAINNLTMHQTWLEGYRKTVEALAQAANARDPHALNHSEHVRDYTMLAANSLSLSQ
ncbi:GAF domain-containing protein, partial [Chloroflexota bacterium]